MKYIYKLGTKPKTLKQKIIKPTLYALTLGLTVFLLASSRLSVPKASAISQPGTINVIEPTYDAKASGQLALKAELTNESAFNYDMFWYVDNGTWNWMSNTPDNTAKQATLSLQGWTWHGTNPYYTITLVSVEHGTNARVYSGVTIQVVTPIAPQPQPTTTSTTPTVSNPTQPTSTTAPPVAQSTATSFYVNPNSNAAATAASTTDPTMKRTMTKLAATATANWFGDWNTNVQNDVNGLVSAATAANQIPILVTYDIPERDCSGYSGGGASSSSAYQAWIQSFTNGINNRKAIVIVEPDALAQITCLSSGDQATRYQLLKYAVDTIKTNPNAKVYLDAGNPSWVAVGDMANRLNQAGVSVADGFSLNISNFFATPANLTYGNQLSTATGNKHFVVDTSRNGNGSNGQWCNPSGMALGSTPTTNTGDNLADFFLWIKTPGESDGTCNGGPAAGAWWPSYAETLALNAGW